MKKRSRQFVFYPESEALTKYWKRAIDIGASNEDVLGTIEDEVNASYTGVTRRLQKCCTACGDELPAGASFCISCSTPVGQL